jgi:adenosylcobyric acid synthase
MSKKAACLAVLGTGSDVGKSIVVTALCRIFSNQGITVAPFKAQNMSNNSGVTPEGLEMGRAQIVQAEAARIAPHVDMNPVLLKPTSDLGSQVVLNGSAWLDATGRAYYRQKDFLFRESCAALDRLRAVYDLVVMEGAGSCAEVNLIDRDIVNLPMAAYAQAPVILVADINRGGVFAQIVGTLACLPSEHRERIKGFLINRFRGDIELFRDGSAWIEHRTGKTNYGVLPWFHDFSIDAEDAVVIDQPRYGLPNQAPDNRPDQSTDPLPGSSGVQAVAVVRLPHISNFTDFDPLAHVRDLQLIYLPHPKKLDRFRAVILPGSKSTRSDLDWLQATGWLESLKAYVDGGGHLLGICGGYQMLGLRVNDPDGLEGPAGGTPGLGLLPVETVLKAPKTTTMTHFSWDAIAGCGYEIHMGQTICQSGAALLSVHSRNQQACRDEDGCISTDGRILGTYMHGLFDTPAITQRWLRQIGLDDLPVRQLHGPAARDQAYDQLARHFETHIDMDAVSRLVCLGSRGNAGECG